MAARSHSGKALNPARLCSSRLATPAARPRGSPGCANASLRWLAVGSAAISRARIASAGAAHHQGRVALGRAQRQGDELVVAGRQGLGRPSGVGLPGLYWLTATWRSVAATGVVVGLSAELPPPPPQPASQSANSAAAGWNALFILCSLSAGGFSMRRPAHRCLEQGGRPPAQGLLLNTSKDR